VRPRPSTWIAIAAAVLAAMAFVGLPRLGSQVVRASLAAEGAADRAAYAAGSSPWAWRFERADDIVAGHVFGGGTLEERGHALAVTTRGNAPVQIGFPIARSADLGELDRLTLSVAAPASGRYALLVRQTLEGPLLRAAVSLTGSSIALDSLDWRDEANQPAAPPKRAAMLRLEATLPPGEPLILTAAALASDGPRHDPARLAIPPDLSTEALLRWRDRQHAIRPVATFGDAASTPAAPWRRDIVLATYGLLLIAAGLRFRRARPARLHDAALVLVGPIGFIAGMGLSTRPAPADVAMLGMGVAYAAFLTWRRAIPPWRVHGSWRMAGWPLLAIPVAIGLVAAAGHAPVWPSPGRLFVYVGWALFQQWLLLAVFGSILARTLPRAMAVLLTALAFALLHTPNGLLMQLCFVAELGWAWWFFQRRALLPVALAHAAAAVVLQAGLAGGILRSLEVSARYLQ